MTMNNQIKAVASREECLKAFEIGWGNADPADKPAAFMAFEKGWQAAIECMQSLSMGDAADREAVGLGISDNTANLASRQTSPANQQDDTAGYKRGFQDCEQMLKDEPWRFSTVQSTITVLKQAAEALAFYCGEDKEGYKEWLRRMRNDMGDVAHKSLSAITDELKRLGE